MKRYYQLLLFFCSLSCVAQNLLVNGDFESTKGSLDGWTYTTPNTQVIADGTSYYADLSGENGVLYQRIPNLTVGNTYTCTIDFKFLRSKQTTGYGFAIEKSTPLSVPVFTSGSTQLKTLCEGNSGQWITLQDGLEETNVSKSFSLTLPANTTALYICIGTKGVISNLKINAVQLVAEASVPVAFDVKGKASGKVLKDAKIVINGLETSTLTDETGKATVHLPARSHSFTIVRDWFKTYSGTITVGTTPQTVVVQMDSIQKVKDVQTRISKYNDNQTPYPLYGHLWNGGLSYTPEMITKLTSAFDYIIGGGGIANDPSVSDRLHAADPRFQIINYNGGWGVKRALIENRKTDLQYYRCGILSANITATTTTFVLNNPPDNRGNGLIASETGNFITWIRIGNELMKLVSVSSSTTYPITVTVERGLDGSVPVVHLANATVTAPLYTTSPIPGGGNSNLSYFGNMWNVRAENIKSSLLTQDQLYRYDGVWIDILVGWLDGKNMIGGNYTLWDHTNESMLTAANIITYTKNAVKSITDGFYARKGYRPQVYGNNVLYSSTLTPADRAYMMVKTPAHPIVLDGFCHENSWGHMSDSPDNIDNDGNPVPSNDKTIILGEKGHYLEWYIGNTWLNNSKTIALLSQNSLPNQPMTINAGFKNQWFAEDLTDQTRYDFNKYAYASYLMCVDVKADSSIVCRMGISPMVKKGTNVTVKIDTFFYYHIGIPLETRPWNNFEGYRIGTHYLFARKFSNGIILINPYKQDMTEAVTLASITGNQDTYIDPENASQIVTSVQLKSRESKILLLNGQVTSLDSHIPIASMAVFPIPATQSIHIQLAADYFVPGKTVKKEIQLYSAGKLVSTQKITFKEGKAEIHMDHLPAGFYMLQVVGVPGAQKVVHW